MSTAPGNQALASMLLEHLDAEEAWLDSVLARYQGIQHDLAAWDLDAVARHLADQTADAHSASALGVRRAALRNRLASQLGIAGESVNISRLMQHIDTADQALVRQRQQDLVHLGRRVAAAQSAAQRLMLHVHGLSQSFLRQLFGHDRESLRYAADGTPEHATRGQLLEVRT